MEEIGSPHRYRLALAPAGAGTQARTESQVSTLAPSLHAGTQLHQVPSVPVAGRWTVCEVAGKWGAFQSLAGPVYWLRLFDTYMEATEFVRLAELRMAVTK